MTKGKSTRTILVFCVCTFFVIACATLGYFYQLHSGVNDTLMPVNPAVSGTSGSASIRSDALNPALLPVPVLRTDATQDRANAVDARRLVKKYGTTPEEHKAYVDEIKRKQEDKEAHDAAGSKFRESLRAIQKPSEIPSNDAVLRPPW